MMCSGVNDEDSFSRQVDAISSRGRLSELQHKLESAETQNKRAKIEHDRDMASVRKDRQVGLPRSHHKMKTKNAKCFYLNDGYTLYTIITAMQWWAQTFYFKFNFN